MGDDAVRPRARDWLFVGALALVLAVGLVHFGRGLAAESDRAATAASTTTPRTSAPTTAPAPTDATTLPATPTAPATPATPAAPATAGTCWDGRPTTAIALCGLPSGVTGLAWVFPSFSPDRPSCRRSRPADGVPAYAVVSSYVCFERALGRPVTVTYEQVADVEATEAWMTDQVGAAGVVDLPGAHGGRCLMVDGDQRPVRISGMYERYPYLVSVFAPTRKVAHRAWKALVRQRPSGAVLGVRGA